jgi:hypothetical protein
MVCTIYKHYWCDQIKEDELGRAIWHARERRKRHIGFPWENLKESGVEDRILNSMGWRRLDSAGSGYSEDAGSYEIR